MRRTTIAYLCRPKYSRDVYNYTWGGESLGIQLSREIILACGGRVLPMDPFLCFGQFLEHRGSQREDWLYLEYCQHLLEQAHLVIAVGPELTYDQEEILMRVQLLNRDPWRVREQSPVEIRTYRVTTREDLKDALSSYGGLDSHWVASQKKEQADAVAAQLALRMCHATGVPDLAEYRPNPPPTGTDEPTDT